MTKDKKKRISEIIQELYLYPYRTKGENLIRSSAWLASWWIGVKGQEAIDEHALGGAYFIFALSLLLEFFSAQKTHKITRFIHGTFCLLLVITAAFAFVLVTKSSPVEGTETIEYYSLMSTILIIAGHTLCIIMFCNMILIGFEPHKFFYDAEAELNQANECIREAAQKQFTANLLGPQKGGNTQ